MNIKLSLILPFLLLLNDFCCGQDYRYSKNIGRFLISKHMEMVNVPGAQVAVMIDGEMVWNESFGYANTSKEKRVTNQTKFRIASVSKPLTAAALMQMAENDQIDLDVDVRTYIPEFPDKGKPITLRQLAASTGGIRHYTTGDPTYNIKHFDDVVAALDLFKEDALLFDPGTEFSYSSYGWVLISAAMERASGKSFQEIMELSWSEMGMINTNFDLPGLIDSSKTIQYVLKKEDRIQAPFEDRSFIYAGGGYISTAQDLVRFGNKLLQNEYLKLESIAEMWQDTKLPNGNLTKYALGWEVGQSRLGTSIIYHSGSMNTARSHLIIYPEENIVFAYISNTGDHVFFNDREAQNIAESFVSEKRNQLTFEYPISGSWELKTTSLKGKKSKGILKLASGDEGLISGEIKFIRSKKMKSFPVVVHSLQENRVHLMAVTPMTVDFYLKIDNDIMQGIWLHDFNVNGEKEEDDYWKPREIVLTKTEK